MTAPQDPPGPDQPGSPWGPPSAPPPGAAPVPPTGAPWQAAPPPPYGAPPPGYGYPPPPGYPYGGPAPSNGFGLTAMVTGIVTATFGMVPGLNLLALPLGIIALVFGFLARGKAKRGEATNGGQALAGLICAAVGLVVSVLWVVLLFSFGHAATSCQSYSSDTGYSDC